VTNRQTFQPVNNARPTDIDIFVNCNCVDTWWQ